MEPKFYVVLVTTGCRLSPENLRGQIQTTLRVNPETAKLLATNPYTIIMRNVDFERAHRVVSLVEKTGCGCEIVAEGQKFVPPDPRVSDYDEDATMMF